MVLLLTLAVATLLAQSTPPAADASIAGRVVDVSTKTPIAAAQVILIPTRLRPAPELDRQVVAVLTDRDGRYQIDEVLPGRYRLNVAKTGFTIADNQQPFRELSVAAGERRTDLTVFLQRAAVIAGRVVDERGEPLPDARVTALRRAPGTSDSLLPAGGPTQVNDLGEFRLVLRPGEYYVQATWSLTAMFGGSAARRSTAPVPTYFPDTTDPLGAQAISVASGQTYSDVEIRLIEQPAFHVAGVVRTGGGLPVANALVRMTAESAAGRPPAFADSRLPQVHTNARGRFTINNVTNGVYTLMAIAPVVTARAPGGTGGLGVITGGIVSGTASPGVITETRDGVTTEYRDDRGASVPITVGSASIDALAVVVPQQ